MATTTTFSPHRLLDTKAVIHTEGVTDDRAEICSRDNPRIRGPVSVAAPALAFNRTVVLRYRIHLEKVRCAPATINLRLDAVRRITFESADVGLLSPELAAGIRRVKGLRRSASAWGTADARARRSAPRVRHAVDAASCGTTPMIAMLIGHGLRRAELLALRLESIPQREEHLIEVRLARRLRLSPSSCGSQLLPPSQKTARLLVLYRRRSLHSPNCL